MISCRTRRPSAIGRGDSTASVSASARIRRTSDSVYWTGFESEEESEMVVQQAAAAAAAARRQRQYVDPWDLENYAYLRRHVEDVSPDPSLTTPSPAGEPISSAFFYMPAGGVQDELVGQSGGGGGGGVGGCYAGFDEQMFYNTKYDKLAIDDELAYSTYTDVETSSGDRSHSSCGSVSLQLHAPGFRPIPGRRSLVLPKPLPEIEFPDPPSCDYYDIPENHYYSLSECCECGASGNGGSPGGNVQLYATSRSRPLMPSLTSVTYPPHHFGLSKKGLLQIDYSCNWNNLDRLIAK